jgi:required for meiotic nuclear division protein 1
MARALLLGERLDHRRLAVAPGGMTDPIQLARPDGLIAFAFRWGAVVLVDASQEQETALLTGLQGLLSHPLSQPVDETARLQVGAAEDSVDAGGIIHLKDFSIPRLAVVADALAKSAALSHQENTLAQTFDGMEPVVTSLRGLGRMSVSSRSLLRLVGSALAARNRAAARVQPDDKPGMLWDYPALEGLHLRLAEEFELTERSAALDRKLSLIGETTQTLLAMIEARRSRTLEVAIVVFIGMELLTALYTLIFK